MTYAFLLVFSISALYSMDERDLDLAKKLQKSFLERTSENESTKNQTFEDMSDQEIDKRCKKIEENVELQKKLLLRQKTTGDKFQILMKGTKESYQKNTQNFITTFVSRMKEDFDNNRSYTQFLKKDSVKGTLPFNWTFEKKLCGKPLGIKPEEIKPEDNIFIFSTTAFLNGEYDNEKIGEIIREYKNHFENEYAELFKESYMHWAEVMVEPFVNRITQRKGLRFSVIIQEITDEVAEKELQTNQEDFKVNMMELFLLGLLKDPKAREEMQREEFQNFMKEGSKEQNEEEVDSLCVIS